MAIVDYVFVSFILINMEMQILNSAAMALNDHEPSCYLSQIGTVSCTRNILDLQVSVIKQC